LLIISEGKLKPNLFNTKFPIFDLSIIPKGISAVLRTNKKPSLVSSSLSIVFHNLSLQDTLTKLSIGFLKSPTKFRSHFFKETVFKIFPSTKWVKNTNQIFLSVKVDIRNGRIIILSAIDNLLKGQTGQAIQNLNIMSGFSMDEGLDLTNNFP